MLTELRESIRDDLNGAEGGPIGFKAFGYVGESLTPPCAAVVPAEPYMVGPSEVDGIPFTRVGVNLDVLLLAGRDGAKSSAALMDQLIEFSYRALRVRSDCRVVRASRPGVVTVSGSKFLGSVLRIQQVTREP